MKRTRPEVGVSAGASGEEIQTQPTTAPLGSLEFSAALNSDDSHVVLKALDRFTKTVRRQRHEALSTTDPDATGDEDDESVSSTDQVGEGEVGQLHQQKRQKQSPGWTKDTKSYNVPFVGTSVAKGDIGIVVKGEWPTGLLKAYLQSSPLATELTGPSLVPPHGAVHKFLLKRHSSSKQGHKMSHAIHKAYLRALEQLVSAAIPVDTLQHETQKSVASSTDHKFLTPMIRDRLPGLWELIKGGKKDLAALSVRVVAGLAATSVGTARHVARSLEDKLKPGTLRGLLKSSRLFDNRGSREENQKDSGDPNNCDEEPDKKVQEKDAKVKSVCDSDTQEACLLLTCTLLESRDATVLSLISISGNREKKIGAGLLYLALRNGLLNYHFNRSLPSIPQQDLTRADRQYLDTVRRLLNSFRRSVIEAGRKSHEKPMLRQKALAELLSGDALERLCHVALCAPLSSAERKTNLYENAVSESSVEVTSPSPSNTLEALGYEGRRLLFPLLADGKQSPFLIRIERSSSRDASQYTQQVGRALCFLINENGQIPIRSFVIQCVNATPQLLPAIFRLLTLPNIRDSFAFLSRLSLLSQFTREGMIASSSLPSNFYQDKDLHQVLSTIVPLHLKKGIMSKAIQSSNALIAAEMFKLIIAILKKFSVVVSHARGRISTDGGAMVKMLTDEFQKCLPDLQTVLGVRSKFNPFGDFATDSKAVGKESILSGYICDILVLYSKILPEALYSVKFDWMKLLPDDLRLFSLSSPVLQLKTMQALDSILARNRGPASHAPSASSGLCLVFISIMMSATHLRLYRLARKLAIDCTLCGIAKEQKSTEALECTKYEISLWIDGVTSESLATFCAVVDKCSHFPLQHTMTLVDAWKQAFPSNPMAEVCCSPVLVVALCSIPKFPSHFQKLTQQVALKCMLYHRSPLVLAALISHVGSQASLMERCDSVNALESFARSRLVLYSQSLLGNLWKTDAQRTVLLQNAVQELFSSDCFLASLRKPVVYAFDEFCNALLNQYKPDPESFGDDGIAYIRQCLHELSLAECHTDVASTARRILFRKLHAMLELVVQDASTEILNQCTEAVLCHPFICHCLQSCSEISSLNLLLFTRWQHQLCEAELQDRWPSASIDNLLSHFVKEFCAAQGPGPLFLSPISRQKVLAGFMSMPYIKHGSSSAILRRLLEIGAHSVSKKDTQDLLDIHIALSLNWLEISTESNTTLDTESCTCVVESWKKMLQAKPSTIENAASVALCGRLEVVIVNELNYRGDGPQSALMYSLLLGMPTEELVKLCLASKVFSHGYSCTDLAVCKASCVLYSLIQFDCSKFAPSVCRRIIVRKKDESVVDESWNSVAVDLVLVDILKNEIFQENSLYDEAKRAAFSRILAILDNSNGSFSSRQHWILFECLPLTAYRHPAHYSNIIKAAVDALDSTNEIASADIDFDAESRLIELCLLLCETKTSENCFSGGDCVKQFRLATLLWCRFCEHLQRSLRLFYHKKTGVNPTRIYNALFRLFRSVNPFYKVIRSGGDSMLARLVRSSLKYGVNNEEERVCVSSTCLRLVRELTILAANALPGSQETPPSEILMPKNIVSMITTHSKFSQVVACETTEEEEVANIQPLPTDKVKLEVARLLVSCVSLASQRIEFDASTWEVLLAGYTAGVGVVDCTLRRLFHVYSKQLPHEDKEIQTPYLDHFRWAGTGVLKLASDSFFKVGSGSDKETSKSWEWFIYALDLSRVRATIVNFPLWEKMIPTPLSDVEIWSDATKSNVSRGTDAVESDILGTAPDIRYSPSFILSLQCAALEWHFVKAGLSSSDESPGARKDEQRKESFDNSTSADREMYALAAQRLCDGGGLALALVSLSSRCPGVRQLAASVAFFFLRALMLKEAHELATWRDRPQLELILNVVQRGLVIRKAKARSQSDEMTSEGGFRLPKFPAISAVFLARASLVLAKPGDCLFAPLNRYFLKTELDFGAYRDIGRLPAFISFFCSASDELGQARRERLWALQLLKDGFVDEFCYKAVASCHAPELLMTSIESFPRRYNQAEGDLEYILLLDTLSTLIRRGGERAARHLFCRLGLLSWVRSVLVGRTSSQLLPTALSRLAFLRLISAAAQTVHQAHNDVAMVRIEVTVEEICNLAQPVLLFLERIQQEEQAVSIDLGKSVGCTLYCLVAALDQLIPAAERTHHKLDASPNGMCISSVLQLLSKVPSSLSGKAVAAACRLPVKIDSTESKDASECCDYLLRFVLSSEDSLGLVLGVVRRVSLFAKLFESALDPYGHILSLTLACRRYCNTHSEGKLAFTDCISNLLEHHSTAREYEDVGNVAHRIREAG